MLSVLSNVSCDFHTKIKDKSQMMYFPVNASLDYRKAGICHGVPSIKV